LKLDRNSDRPTCSDAMQFCVFKRTFDRGESPDESHDEKKHAILQSEGI
jgi:hypothetical protein